MAGTGPTDLQELAEEFLAACVEALDTIPDYAPALEGAPTRYFVSPGTPALDCCPQLTVHVQTLTEGASAPFPPKASRARINRVEMIAQVARCVPIIDPETGALPSVEDQQFAAEQVNADKWALWNHIYNMINAGLLFDKCCDVVWGPLRATVPSGGCGGATLTVVVCYDGYEEEFGT
jgi:hypothetical protein